MHFTDNHVKAILAGRKTMTRIIARPVVAKPRPGNRPAYDTRPFTPKVGMKIPFRYDASDPDTDPDMRGRAYLIVTECTDEPQRVDKITTADAKAENHHSVEEFMEWWVRQYDKPWVAVRLRRVEGVRDGETFLGRQLQARFAARHADTKVWPVRFVLDTSHQTRYLLPASRGDLGDGVLGFTDNASRAIEPVEAVDPDDLGITWKADAQARHTDVRGDELFDRLAKSVGSRMRENLIAARRAGLDVTADLAAMQRMVEEIEHRRDAA